MGRLLQSLLFEVLIYLSFLLNLSLRDNLGNELKCHRTFEDVYREKSVRWTGQLDTVSKNIWQTSKIVFFMGGSKRTKLTGIMDCRFFFTTFIHSSSQIKY